MAQSPQQPPPQQEDKFRGEKQIAGQAINSATNFAANRAQRAAVKLVKSTAIYKTLAMSLANVLPGIGHLVALGGTFLVHKLGLKKMMKGAVGAALAVPALAIGTIGSIAAVSSAILGTLATIAATTAGAVALISVLVVPLFIAFILLIINSGAFLVPPATGLTLSPGSIGTQNSPYIKITKTASPAGPFENSDIPFEVTYTIVISAPLDTLKNVVYEYECEVIQQEGSNPCPTIDPAIPSPPSEIVKGGNITITYKANYNNSVYNDSMVLDSFRVSASTPTAANAKSQVAAAIVIGDPPTACFLFASNWPEGDRNIEIRAIAQMTRARKFIDKLCGGGPITLNYSATQSEVYGARITGPRQILIYPLGIGTLGNALYTIAHESGHVLAQVTNLQTLYLDDDNVVPERELCTYRYDPHPPSEDFAEMVALYISQAPGSTHRNFDCMPGGIDLKSKYPNHWFFARQKIFEESLGW